MSSRHRIQALLRHPAIWQARRSHDNRRPVLTTGFRELDQALAGGWPVGALSELLVTGWGLGEFRLLIPALGALTTAADQSGWIMFVNPPYIPYAPGLSAAGVDVSRIVVVRSENRSDTFWSIEQSVRSDSFSAVIGFCEAADSRALRRLQLAAESTGCWVLLFRPVRFCRQRSPAALRIRLTPARQRGLAVKILKRRGGQPRQLVLDA
ncbi:MAG: translesion DNA synthesis-associated protein ImuA [Gammaproteobacteria bacterium]|nr:translesion DNA synthesis-associated protein ImuA [Gammaproteobacteria bacterium]